MSALAEAPPTRRERRRLEVRERIVEASRGLFESKGYEATTVEEIARASDIAYGTFFNHFPAKIDLLRELSHVMLIGLFEDVEEAWGRRGSFGEHLVWIFETAAERAEEKGPRARELLRAMMSLAFPETAEADDRRMRAMFRKLLEDGRAAGDVRVDEDVETLTEVFVGTWYSMFLSWVHTEGYPLRERAAATARFLSRILAAPSRAR
ncbi:MAG: TetR/AcrR family transcriptional regulator [Candidatus Binatia bacterium]|nr:TetR/AcrR family transcriptional regulator [Candidatus Binatia bacterium]